MTKFQAKYIKKPGQAKGSMAVIMDQLNYGFRNWKNKGKEDPESNSLTELRKDLYNRMRKLFASYSIQKADQVEFVLDEEKQMLEVRMKDELLVTYS